MDDKPVSDTPKSDAQQGWYLSDGRWWLSSKSGTVRVEFARNLERELAVARRVVEAAKALADNCEECYAAQGMFWHDLDNALEEFEDRHG